MFNNLQMEELLFNLSKENQRLEENLGKALQVNFELEKQISKLEELVKALYDLEK